MTIKNTLYTFAKPQKGLASRVYRLEAAAPYQRAGANVFSRGKYVTPAAGSVLGNGQVSPILGVAGHGNLAPNVINGTVGFLADDTSLTICWDGSNGSSLITVSRADGTRFSIPAGKQVVTGLSASTRYGFSISWKVNNTLGLTFGPGDVGSPQIAISPSASSGTIQTALHVQQNYDAEATYAGLCYFSTTAPSGSNSGSATDKSGTILSKVRVKGIAGTT